MPKTKCKSAERKGKEKQKLRELEDEGTHTKCVIQGIVAHFVNLIRIVLCIVGGQGHKGQGQNMGNICLLDLIIGITFL